MLTRPPSRSRSAVLRNSERFSVRWAVRCSRGMDLASLPCSAPVLVAPLRGKPIRFAVQAGPDGEGTSTIQASYLTVIQQRRAKNSPNGKKVEKVP